MTKKNKTKRVKNGYRSEEQTEIIRFITILVVLIALVLVVYFFTRMFVTKDLFNKEEEKTTAGAINYNIATIGTMLNRVEDEYYVMIYNTENANASYYNSLVSRYKQNEKPLTVYMVDLNNELNKKYYDKEHSNLNAKDLENFRVSDVALLKVKNGKVVKALEAEDKIDSELALKKDTKK